MISIHALKYGYKKVSKATRATTHDTLYQNGLSNMTDEIYKN